MATLRLQQALVARAALLVPVLFGYACGDEQDPGKKDNLTDASADAATVADAGAADAAATTPDAAGNDCPADLECVAPSGRYLCEKPGPEVVTCEKLADCSFGMCYKLAGQGICLQLCTPAEPLPSETTVGGTVVELQPGKGLTGTSEPAQEPLLSGVKVCVVSPETVKVECATTGADGKFTISKLPPNRNAAMTVTAVLSFEKEGYLPQLQAFSLGDGSQKLGNQVRLLTTAYATTLASSLGGTLPSATTGWLQVNAVKFNAAGPDSRYGFVQGALKLTTLDGVAISSAPAAGKGPFYTDAEEQPRVADTDAGVAATTPSGHAYFVDAPPGMYQVSFAHPTLTCGDTPIPASVVPGFVFAAVGTACGNGVK